MSSADVTKPGTNQVKQRQQQLLRGAKRRLTMSSFLDGPESLPTYSLHPNPRPAGDARPVDKKPTKLRP